MESDKRRPRSTFDHENKRTDSHGQVFRFIVGKRLTIHPSKMTATHDCFVYAICFLQSNEIEESDKEDFRKLIQQGSALLPLGQHVKTAVANVWGIAVEKIQSFKDSEILDLGFKQIYEEEIALALVSHAKVIDAFMATVLGIAKEES